MGGHRKVIAVAMICGKPLIMIKRLTRISTAPEGTPSGVFISIHRTQSPNEPPNRIPFQLLELVQDLKGI